MTSTEACPIERSLQNIGKKWSLNIIRDLFMGKKRFTEFLHSNKGLSTKMLAARLRELEKAGLMHKQIVNKNPVTIEYSLTPRGRALNKLLYELAEFSLSDPESGQTKEARQACLTEAREILGI